MVQPSNKAFAGVNSVILLEVRIGINEEIGPSMLEGKDIPSCSHVVGNSGRVIDVQGANSNIQ